MQLPSFDNCVFRAYVAYSSMYVCRPYSSLKNTIFGAKFEFELYSHMQMVYFIFIIYSLTIVTQFSNSHRYVKIMYQAQGTTNM